jgi:hypothetical protein
MTFSGRAVPYKRAAIILLAFSAALLAGGTASASPINVDHANAKQNSGECDFPLKSSPADGADNAINCRSTKSEIALYLTNSGDSSDCTFDLKVTWGDGKTDSLPKFTGGPAGREFLADHDYSDVGIYTIGVTGKVVSGDCSFNGGDLQFSRIPAAAPYPEGPPISAAKILNRAADWTAARVPYSQAKYYGDINGTYREDCSGFTSMAWDLDFSLSTAQLSSVATRVASGFKGIEPGDAILKSGDHVFIFVKWYNAKHTQAWIYEEAGLSSSSGSGATEKHFGLATFKGYKIYRYKNER